MFVIAVHRGDTIVEVMVAFAVFTLVAIGSVTVMNRGLAVAERSLEVTLVRQQINAEVALLRYARDANLPAWQAIKGNLAASGSVADQVDVTSGCPSTPPSPAAFMLGFSGTTPQTLSYISLNSPSTNFQKSSYYSTFDLAGHKAAGLWVIPVKVSGSTDTYDMYVQACWDAPDASRPVTLGTIVRLYDT